jgi:hypothetical protein
MGLVRVDILKIELVMSKGVKAWTTKHATNLRQQSKKPLM